MFTSRFNRFVRPPSDTGNDPERLFPFSFNTDSLLKPLSVDGIVPPILFTLTSNDPNDVNTPSDDGRDPTRPADPTPIDTTTLPAHVTPDHDDVVADVHTGPFFGLFPTHCQELNDNRLGAEIAADRSHIIESSNSNNEGDEVGTINGTSEGDDDGPTDGDNNGVLVTG